MLRTTQEQNYGIALRKRKVDNDVVERAQNGIVRQLESSGEVEIQSDLPSKMNERGCNS